MSPLEAAVEEARLAWSCLPSDAPDFVRRSFRADLDAAMARRAAHWSPGVVISGIESEAIARAPMLPAYVAPNVQWIGNDGLTDAREAAIATRDALDSAARESEARMYVARQALDSAIGAYVAAFVAARADSAAYSNAADVCCALGEEANRRIRALSSLRAA